MKYFPQLAPPALSAALLRANAHGNFLLVCVGYLNYTVTNKAVCYQRADIMCGN